MLQLETDEWDAGGGNGFGCPYGSLRLLINPNFNASSYTNHAQIANFQLSAKFPGAGSWCVSLFQYPFTYCQEGKSNRMSVLTAFNDGQIQTACWKPLCTK